jgi:xylulokinase
MGCVEAGDAFLSLGTSGVLFAVNNRYSPNAGSAVHAFCHALPDTWHQMGVILSATDALNWLASVTGKSPAELDAQLPEKPSRPSGLTFLPYLSGERTPHNDASIRGVLAGLHHDADSTTLTKAVLEGVSFAFRDCLDALAAAGTRVDRVTAVGGGSKSAYWLQLLATVLGVRIDVPQDGDFGAAFGAARLGLIAREGFSPTQVCRKPQIARTYEPDNKLTETYRQALHTYRALYPALKILNKNPEETSR